MISSSQSQESAECLIIGGGIIALSIAEQLSRHGVQVRVVAHQPVHRIASWAAAGILPPPIKRAIHDPLEQLRELSHRRYREWCDRLTRESGIDVTPQTCGGIYVGRSVGERIALAASLEQWKSDGVRVDRWTRAELACQEPDFGPLPDSADIYVLPEETQVRPPRLLRALTTTLAGRGIPVEPSSTPVRWQDVERRIVMTSAGPIRAAHVCLAVGPWIDALLEPLSIRLPVEPRRGQMVLWKLKSPILQRIINEGPRYLLGREDGHLLAGSTVEDVGFDASTTASGIDELIDFACGFLPQLADVSPVDTWAALRPMPIDGLPYLGLVPGHSQISVATGHFRSGVHLAPATGELMRQLIRGQTTALDLDAFRLSR